MRRLARGRRGGGFEYHASLLPEPTRVAIYQYELQFAAGPAGDVPPAASSPLETAAAPGRDPGGAKQNSFVTSFEHDGKRRRALIEMPLWARETADARAALLDALAHFAAAANAATATSPLILARFAESWNAGHITTDSDAHSLIQRAAAPTILRWHRLRARGGLAALAPRYGNRRGSGILDTNPAVRELLLAMIARYGKHLRAPRVAEAIAAKFPALRISKSAIRVFLRRWHRENASLSEAINNPDRWKGKYRIKIAKADEAIVRLNQEWQIDGTPGDVMLISDNIQGRSPHLDIAGGVEPLRGSTSAHLKLKRHHILALIDVFSRRVMFHVAPSEGAAPAVRLISRAMIAWGVPEIIHGDNGKGFISNYAQRSLADLGIRYLASPPFQPETKPFVESVIGTMAHELLAMLPGFIGHSVAQRQEIRARSSFAARFGAPPEKIFQVNLTAAELQAKLDAWAEHLYGDRPHSGLDGKSPNQLAAEWGGEIRNKSTDTELSLSGERQSARVRLSETEYQVKRIGDERALALLAEHAVRRRIGREGIALEGARFVAVELGAYVGQDVTVFPDPSGDMGVVHVFLETRAGREFLCQAVNVERLGLDRSNLAILARQAQNRYIREQRAEMRRIKNRIKPETLIDAVLAHASEEKECGTSERFHASRNETDAGFALLIPNSGSDAILHETPALAAASIAVEASDIAALFSPFSEAAWCGDNGAARKGEKAARKGEKRRPLSESEEWAAEWDRYRGLRACADISEADRAWMVRYEASPEFRAYRRLEERAA